MEIPQLYLKALRVAAAVASVDHQRKSSETCLLRRRNDKGSTKPSAVVLAKWRPVQYAHSISARRSSSSYKSKRLFYKAFRQLVLGNEGVCNDTLEECTERLVTYCSEVYRGVEEDIALFTTTLAKFVLSTNVGGALRAVYVVKSLAGISVEGQQADATLHAASTVLRAVVELLRRSLKSLDRLTPGNVVVLKQSCKYLY